MAAKKKKNQRVTEQSRKMGNNFKPYRHMIDSEKCSCGGCIWKYKDNEGLLHLKCGDCGFEHYEQEEEKDKICETSD